MKEPDYNVKLTTGEVRKMLEASPTTEKLQDALYDAQDAITTRKQKRATILITIY